jgi:hypothetical protein
MPARGPRRGEGRNEKSWNRSECGERKPHTAAGGCLEIKPIGKERVRFFDPVEIGAQKPSID